MPTANTRANGFSGKSSEGNDMKVVVRRIPIFGKWYICHAASYQNAFREAFNGYADREDAANFARQQGCKVVFHEHDQLQHH